MLREYIDSYRTISIIGISKNAGKTTVLNQLIDEYSDITCGITSIGMDGEKIDTITSRPKPRIKVYPKTIIATANDCLMSCDFNFIIHEKMNIRTPLGDIMIVEAVTEGFALVAGPSTNREMVQVINKLKKYACKKIFIDGALFRKSIASFRVAEASILATGASYNDDMNTVVNDTKILVDQFSLEQINSKDRINMIRYDSHLHIDNQGHLHPMKEQNLLGNEKHLENYLLERIRAIYIKGAFTDKMIEVLLENRNKIKQMNVVVNDATHIIASAENVRKLEMTNYDLKVLNKLNLLFVTCNPVSPNGTVFDKKKFKKALKNTIDIPIINVLEDYNHE